MDMCNHASGSATNSKVFKANHGPVQQAVSQSRNYSASVASGKDAMAVLKGGYYNLASHNNYGHEYTNTNYVLQANN